MAHTPNPCTCATFWKEGRRFLFLSKNHRKHFNPVNQAPYLLEPMANSSTLFAATKTSNPPT